MLSSIVNLKLDSEDSPGSAWLQVFTAVPLLVFAFKFLLQGTIRNAAFIATACEQGACVAAAACMLNARLRCRGPRGMPPCFPLSADISWAHLLILPSVSGVASYALALLGRLPYPLPARHHCFVPPALQVLLMPSIHCFKLLVALIYAAVAWTCGVLLW